MTVLEHRPSRVPMTIACRALGLNRATVYARRKRACPDSEGKTSRRHSYQPRALSGAERQHILSVVNSSEFWDQPPYEVYHELLQRGEYLCSQSTFYRLLRQQSSQGERRPQRAPQSHVIPRITATRPNEVWSWDITKLPTYRRGVYLNLYVVLDLFSRFIVAWMISGKENAALAQQLIQEAVERYRIDAGELTLHQDRGSPMIARSYLDLMGDLGVTCSHSRPRVSNDNPFSESQFKTKKQQPDYPGRFEGIAHAQQWNRGYVDWYNFEHHHSGLAGFTPEQVYTGRYLEVAKVRQQALDEQYDCYPERFVKGRPIVAMPLKSVSINPIQPEDEDRVDGGAVNFPTLPAAKHTARKSTLIC